MSSSMPIPTRASADKTSHSSPFAYSASPSSISSSAGSPNTLSSWKGKSKVPVHDQTAASSSSSPPPERISPRRPSLLGSSLAKSEYTVVNLAHHDGPPRLVTCVKRSQGFDWNQGVYIAFALLLGGTIGMGKGTNHSRHRALPPFVC